MFENNGWATGITLKNQKDKLALDAAQQQERLAEQKRAALAGEASADANLQFRKEFSQDSAAREQANADRSFAQTQANADRSAGFMERNLTLAEKGASRSADWADALNTEQILEKQDAREKNRLILQNFMDLTNQEKAQMEARKKMGQTAIAAAVGSAIQNGGVLSVAAANQLAKVTGRPVRQGAYMPDGTFVMKIDNGKGGVDDEVLPAQLINTMMDEMFGIKQNGKGGWDTASVDANARTSALNQRMGITDTASKRATLVKALDHYKDALATVGISEDERKTLLTEQKQLFGELRQLTLSGSDSGAQLDPRAPATKQRSLGLDTLIGASRSESSNRLSATTVMEAAVEARQRARQEANGDPQLEREYYLNMMTSWGKENPDLIK